MSERDDAIAVPRLTRKGKATRERIVETAAQLMFDGGVAGTSIDDVKRAAGVSSSQLYHYFVDKQALVHAVIAHQTQVVLDVQRPLLSALDSFEALETWRDVIVGLQADRHGQGGCPIGSLGGELAEVDVDARNELADSFAQWESAIRDGLHAMRERGVLGPDADPDRLALAMLAALQGGLLLTQIRRETTPLEVALDAAIAHVETFRAVA
ncbi:TetR/AcrR family transcriptional regulator [Conexibacter sp. CPCC 206217]|uniref:TetR/AcrR family transcriptional regulator n=1 Tax=Conexibacter sp. CPCC 206217 TaxID=3064574 RepID=UPI002723A328|nr:TetR/AcrR family transcriptional regulator [Conexibacter sp. CPCC 206217]MDO8212631.1 TetR/AcrR family transcriptional regulator [Conexibacter sp. CPCC 206217]